jgi:signal transduction histidine kinase
MQPRIQTRSPGTETFLALERAERLLASFQQVLGHDLPNHLIAVQGLARVLELEEGERLSPAGRELLARLSAAAQRAHGLVSTLAEIGSVGREIHPPERIPLAELGQEVAAEINQLFPGRRMEYDFSRAAVPVFAPRAAVRRLLVQLVRNAVQASPDDSPVYVELGARETSTGQEFWVADRRPGLASEQLRQLRDFLEGRSANPPGGNLGLMLVRRLVEHVGGKLRVESAPITGTVLTVALEH